MLASLGAATASAAAGAGPAPSPEGEKTSFAPPSGFAELSAALAAIGPRPENSLAEAAAFALIETTLKGAGIETTSKGLGEGEGGHSFSRIVESRIPGDREDEIAVVTPVTSFSDSIDPSEGIAGLALALAEAQRRGIALSAGSTLPISMRFVFLGAERRGSRSAGEEASFGSERWISGDSRGEKLAVIYLSADRASGPVFLCAAGKGILAPFWYYDRARLALAASGADLRLEPNKLQVYRLGLVDRAGPIAPYLEANIPALEIRSVPDARTAAVAGDGGALPTDATGEWFPRFIDGFIAASEGGFLSDWDKHYLPLQLGRFSAVIRERTYVLFVVSFATLVSVSVLAVTIFRRDAVKHLLRRMPVASARLLAILAAILAVFLFGKLMARIDATILGSDEAWKLAPKILAIARTASSFLLFLGILSILVERKILTPNPYFYEAAALV
ncbi:MAG: hypothetical protein Q8M76_10385, partial [Spirochaetaceae bacterium]|nr:hypothetical protein [Spirochaetaceae bacterium]